MTRKKHPDDLVVKPFTVKDDKIFMKLYGVLPVKELLPMMEHPHSLDTMYSHADLLDVSKRIPLWKDQEKMLLDAALRLDMSYQEIAEASKAHSGVRNMTEAGITQYLYRVRKGQGEGNE